jgi:galactose mutarotase-like enzyme
MKAFSRKSSASTAPALGTVELNGGGSKVVMVPALGGKISALHVGGRQWLWTSATMPYALPDERAQADDASYVETADTGGYDECFPTVGACVLPMVAGAFAQLRLPDHGELWSQRPDFQLRASGDAQEAQCTWEGRRMPYRFRRTVRVDSSGTVTMRYAAENLGRERLPFLWSAHPLLPMTKDTRLELPEDARVRVYAAHHLDLGGPMAEHRWPMFEVDGKRVDFSRPDAVARRYACKLFLDMPSGRAAVIEGDARLEVTFDATQVPNFGLWLNRKGWTPFAGGRAYHNFAFEPCIGAPDPLSDAFGSWDGAHWIEGGEKREWELVWRGVSG